MTQPLATLYKRVQMVSPSVCSRTHLVADFLDDAGVHETVALAGEPDAVFVDKSVNEAPVQEPLIGAPVWMVTSVPAGT